MFSQTKIAAKVLRVQQRLINTSPLANGRPIFSAGFKLTEHSISEVEQANSHFKALRRQVGEDKFEQLRPYNSEEIRWIRNEWAMCRCSFLYWATRYGYIIGWGENLMRFSPNIAQSMALDLFAQLEDRDAAILILALKARQLGISTLSELIAFWKAIFFARSRALVGSSRPEKSAEMYKMMDVCWKNQPYWLIPQRTAVSVSNYMEFGGQDSKIVLRHGAQKSGVGRGGTYATFHLSEITEFEDPESDIDAALLRAVHDSPWVFGILETTAKRRHDYYHNKWQFAEKNWPIGRSRLCPMFLPWFVGTDLYPTPTWLRTHPIPEDWNPEDLTIYHAKQAREYVQSGRNSLLTTALGSSWEMPLEQMWFWETTRLEYAETNRLNDFYAELCANPEEAFQNANSSIFTTEVLEGHRALKTPPIGVYGLIGPQEEIPPRFQPKSREFDPSRPAFEVKCDFNPTGRPLTYKFQPILQQGPGLFSPDGKIILYSPPSPGVLYGLGIDTSHGVGKDSSVIEGLAAADGQNPCLQAFEFASPWINSFTLWPFSLALGTLYTYSNQDGRVIQPKMVIELAANGALVQNELRKRGWTNFHLMPKFDRRIMGEATATTVGWQMTESSRRLMLDMLQDAVNSGWFQINSPWLIDDLGNLEWDEDHTKIAAAPKTHDDRPIAAGIALFSLHTFNRRGIEGWMQRRYATEAREEAFAKFNGGGIQAAPVTGVAGVPGHSYKYRVVEPGDPNFGVLERFGAILGREK